MGFLDRAIRRGISNAIGNAVENGVRRAVEPKIEQAAASAVNSAANSINQAVSAPQQTMQTTQTTQTTQTMQTTQPRSAVNQAEVAQASATLGGLFGGLTTYANEAAKNMKICPSCGEGAGRDVKFCPKCGSKLPEETLGDSAICPSCGKQNAVGTKFCADCGTKLPCTVAEENAAQAADDEVMARWDALLPQYPKWNLGGREFNIEQYDGYIMFAVRMDSNFSAQNAVKQYRELLLQNGFRQAGKALDPCHLYKMSDGVCYHCDTEHCFDGDSDCPLFSFNIGEPIGGFNYVKPEQKKISSFKDFFNF